MGGTNTAYALISRDGTVVERGSLPTTGHISAQVWAEKLWESLREMIERNGVGEEIEGIGIGAPCANTITGCIEAATDLPWPSPIPLKERMERLSGIKVSVANDANAAAHPGHRSGERHRVRRQSHIREPELRWRARTHLF